ncbi:unnamed protein product [Brassica oleracea]
MLQCIWFVNLRCERRKRVREEEDSLVREEKKIRRRRLVLSTPSSPGAVVTDLNLVASANYSRRRHPSSHFSDPYSPVSLFTVPPPLLVTTLVISLSHSLSLSLFVLNLFLLQEGGQGR